MSELSLYKTLTRDLYVLNSSSDTPVALIVDDEKPILNALKRLFLRSGIKVFLAESGADGLSILRHQHVDVVISDMRMPKMDGGQFLAIVAEKYPDTVRIVLTGHSDLQQTIEVVNTAKIYQYVYKPWDDVDLLQTVRAGIEQARLIQENKRLVHLTQDQNEQLIELNAQLQMDIHERTDELQKTTEALVSAYRDEQKIREEQRRAEKENAAKSRFLATISHEIRSPLNAVITMNSLLLGTELNEDQHNYAVLAKEGGETLMALVNDILDLSKLEGGYLDLIEDWFNPAEMTERLTELYFNQARRKYIDLQCVIDPRINTLFFGDAKRIKQVLINLVANAIKFTESGGVCIHCYIDENSQVCWRVTDTGIGVAPEDQEKIFGYFVQADDEDNRRFGGSGLGLSIVKQLLDKMQGSIALESQKGDGSAFLVRIPLKAKTALQEHNSLLETDLVYVGEPFKNYEVLGHQFDLLLGQRWQHLSVSNFLQESSELPNVTIINCASLSSLHDVLPKVAEIKSKGGLVYLYSDCANQQERQELNERECDGLLKKPLLYSSLKSVLEGNSAAVNDISQQEKTQRQQLDTRVDACASKDSSKDYRYSVLAAEDSQANQAILQAILKNKPLDIDFACNGLEALEKASQQPYDLILMDLAMPEMDGVDAVKAIRATAQPNKNTPVIAMTANAQYADRVRCIDAGMNDFVAKPIDIDLLIASIEAWLPSADKNKANKEMVQRDQGERRAEFINKTKVDRLAADATWPVLQDILEIYIDETLNRAERINQYFTENEWQKIADEAHALKSSSGSFGAEFLYQAAKELESAAKLSNRKRVCLYKEQISDNLDDVISALRNYVAERGGKEKQE